MKKILKLSIFVIILFSLLISGGCSSSLSKEEAEQIALDYLQNFIINVGYNEGYSSAKINELNNAFYVSYSKKVDETWYVYITAKGAIDGQPAEVIVYSEDNIQSPTIEHLLRE